VSHQIRAYGELVLEVDDEGRPIGGSLFAEVSRLREEVAVWRKRAEDFAEALYSSATAAEWRMVHEQVAETRDLRVAVERLTRERDEARAHDAEVRRELKRCASGCAVQDAADATERAEKAAARLAEVERERDEARAELEEIRARALANVDAGWVFLHRERERTARLEAELQATRDCVVANLVDSHGCQECGEPEGHDEGCWVLVLAPPPTPNPEEPTT
jgi:hypothetical protein